MVFCTSAALCFTQVIGGNTARWLLEEKKFGVQCHNVSEVNFETDVSGIFLHVVATLLVLPD